MGGGSYDYLSSRSRSQEYQAQSREEVFTQTEMNPEMNIKGKIRESCDSQEHPDSFPIIIALDVTGSMTFVPEKLIKGIFPDIMQRIAEQGVEHAQVCFVAFGDHYTDFAPLQVGQFETSDSLLDKWLKLIYLEGGGGGNGGESALLAYYFAAYHTSCDHITKRHQKGVLITISDECTHRALSRGCIQKIFGSGIETEQVTVEELLDDVSQNWDVYHYLYNDYSARRQQAESHWMNTLGDKGVSIIFDSPDNLKDSIPAMVVKTYEKSHPINGASTFMQNTASAEVKEDSTYEPSPDYNIIL